MDGHDSIEVEGDQAHARDRFRAGRSTPRAHALRAERAMVATAGAERFAGYGVIGLPFAGGDVLAFRRFPASSIGGGYSSIWHRDREYEWTFYVSIEPSLGCPRYFGDAIDRVVVTPIETTWVGHDHLVVSAPAPRVEWSMRIRPTAATRLVSAAAGLMPRRAWRDDRMLSLLGTAAGVAVGAGPLRLAGVAPNGQGFRVRPRRVWRVDASAAQVEGRELGPLGGDGAELGDFRLPGVGLFACGEAEFDTIDRERHSTRVGRDVERTSAEIFLGGPGGVR